MVVSVLCVVVAIAGGGKIMARGDADFAPNLYFHIKDVSNADAAWAANNNVTMVDWNEETGLVHANWTVDTWPEPNTIYGFFPKCVGFDKGQAVDKHGHHFALDYWTPNGTADLHFPQARWKRAPWLMEISEQDVWDCRDRYDELPADTSLPQPKVLTAEQEKEIQEAKDEKFCRQKQNCDLQAVYNAYGLRPEQENFWAQIRGYCERIAIRNKKEASERRSVAITSYFANLPTNPDAVRKYAVSGADELMRAMKEPSVRPREQARILHQAFSTIFSTHHTHKCSWKRYIPLAPRTSTLAAITTDVVDHTVRAVIEQAEPHEKSWMQMLAIGAVTRSMRESIVAGTAGKAEVMAMEKMFERM